MKIGELEVNFEPLELPKDYKFVYKINGCEHKVDFDTNTIVDKILSARTKKVDEEIIRQLRNIGEEKGVNELILIDESKVLNLVKAVKALEIIKKFGLEIHITEKNAFVTSNAIKGIFNAYIYITDKKDEIELLKSLKEVLL